MKFNKQLSLIAVLAACGNLSLSAQEANSSAATAMECLTQSEVESATLSADHSAIVYRMEDGKLYKNVLGGFCASIKGNTAFSYFGRAGTRKTRRICSGDLVSETIGRYDITNVRGSCLVTEFVPISENEAATLLEASDE